jgi:hypothetical protein
MAANSGDLKGPSLWGWPVVGPGVGIVYSAGLAALFGDQFDLAAILLVGAIVWVTVKALTSPELGSHGWSFAGILVGSLLCFLSLWWVQSRLDTMAERHPNLPTQVLPTQVSAPEAPLITWNPPSSMEAGTPLASRELNASASFGGKPLDGSFVYNPALGATLPIGSDTLSVIFYPTDSAKYSTQTQTTTLIVSPSRKNPSAVIPAPPPPSAPSAPTSQGGNLSERALALANAMMIDVVERGYQPPGGHIDLPAGDKPFLHLPMPTDSKDYRDTWWRNMRSSFRFHFGQPVIDIHDEFSQLHLRDQNLDDWVKEYQSEGNRPDSILPVNPHQIQQIADSLVALANRLTPSVSQPSKRILSAESLGKALKGKPACSAAVWNDGTSGPANLASQLSIGLQMGGWQLQGGGAKTADPEWFPDDLTVEISSTQASPSDGSRAAADLLIRALKDQGVVAILRFTPQSFPVNFMRIKVAGQ